MEKSILDYKGLDNRDLKLLNVEDWEIPIPWLRNPKIKKIMGCVQKMEPGEVVKTYISTRREAMQLQSALWRLFNKHKIDVKIMRRDRNIFLKKKEDDAGA